MLRSPHDQAQALDSLARALTSLALLVQDLRARIAPEALQPGQEDPRD